MTRASLPTLSRLTPARVLSGRAASTSTPSSTPGRRWGSPRRGRAASRSCRAQGGSHFDKLIKQQGARYDSSSKHDETEAALHAFWLGRGVREEAYRSRLVGMGATLASSVSERELYRNPDQLGHSLDRLQKLFPGINVAEMMWKEPEVLRLPLRHVAAQLVSLRWAMPAVDVNKIVAGQPGLLLRDVGEAAAAVRALQDEFPSVDVSRVVEREPSLLTADCDVQGRLRRLARLKSAPGGLSPSLATFYDGGAGSTNVTLFAKVFLEETRGGGEAYESDTAWG